jgi:hypothetical protein
MITKIYYYMIFNFWIYPQSVWMKRSIKKRGFKPKTFTNSEGSEYIDPDHWIHNTSNKEWTLWGAYHSEIK